MLKNFAESRKRKHASEERSRNLVRRRGTVPKPHAVFTAARKHNPKRQWAISLECTDPSLASFEVASFGVEVVHSRRNTGIYYNPKRQRGIPGHPA
jgi:hypothetical protein